MGYDLKFTTEEGIEYPVGLLKDIKIYFQHYKTEEEAKAKWNERAKRMDYDKLFILFTDRDGCTEQDIVEFDNLPYKNKVIFVNKPHPNIKSAVYIRGFENDGCVGPCMAYKSKISYKKYYDDFDYVDGLTWQKSSYERRKNMSLFKGKTLMITGGTGSFGNAVLNRFLQTDIGEIRIFSRDEKKQDDMRHEYQVKMPEVADKIKFYIGDVRDLNSVRAAMPGVDYIFHAAALKQVPSCEFFPMEAVKTNVVGTDNVLTAAIEAGVESVICLSTDKAAYPINAMGITKAIEEKVAVAKSRNSGKTKICCTRYGNVMCSRGSVIPLWIDQIKSGNPITVTEPSMTRFIMSLEEAVDLVLFAFEKGENGDLLIMKAPACTIQTQAEAVCELFGGKKEDIKVIGIRHGEKMYETLLTNEECAKAIDLGGFYRVPADNRGLNYDKYFKDGDAKRNTLTEFNSNNTKLLTLEETKATIAKLAYIQERLAED